MASSSSKTLLSSAFSSSSSFDFLKEIELLNQIEKEVNDRKEEFKSSSYDSKSVTHEHFEKKLDEIWERANKNIPSQRDYLQARVRIISALMVTYARDISHGYTSSVWGVITPPDKALQILGPAKYILRTLSEDKEEKSFQVAQLAKAKLNEIEGEEIITEIRIMSQNEHKLPFPGEDFLTIGNIEALKAFKELKDKIYHRAHFHQKMELLLELKRIITLFPSKELEEKGACCTMLKAAELLISKNELHFLRLFLNEGILLAAAKKLCPAIEDPFDPLYEFPLSAKEAYDQLKTQPKPTVLPVTRSIFAEEKIVAPPTEKKEEAMNVVLLPDAPGGPR